MPWSEWMDSYDEREEYMFAVHNLIPATGGLWGQPMFTLKYTSCEDPTREGCSCTRYDEKHKGNRGFDGIDFTKGAVWSSIMARSEEALMSESDVGAYID